MNLVRNFESGNLDWFVHVTFIYWVRQFRDRIGYSFHDYPFMIETILLAAKD